jgi:hypothetical protein
LISLFIRAGQEGEMVDVNCRKWIRTPLVVVDLMKREIGKESREKWISN